MTDIALVWQGTHGDIAVDGTDLLADDGLDTAVMLSLFLDRRAEDADKLPDDVDPRGWWGDSFAEVLGDAVGSRLWLLGREKQLPSVANRVQEYAAEALAWLVDDGVASKVNTQATWVAPGMCALTVTIYRPSSPTPFTRQFQNVWSAM
jgi:phage gp46-like protein